MKILYVIDKLPCPAYAGVHLRTLNIGRQLGRYNQVKTVLVCAEKEFQDTRYESSSKELGEITKFTISGPKPGTPIDKLSHKFWQHWPGQLTKPVNSNDQKRFEEMAADYDLIWYETLLPAARFRYFGSEKAIIDLDDLNHLKWDMLNKQRTGIRQHIANKCIIKKWEKAEISALRKFSMIGLCSEKDKSYLAERFPEINEKTYIIPNGFENIPAPNRSDTKAAQLRIGFIGILEYRPNLEGLSWFIDQVWPKVLEKRPDTILRVVGKVSDSITPPKGANIEYTGFVNDVSEEFNSWTTMIVPLLSGGGTRLKILESFARGCPVISTGTGAYGLKINENNIIICDDPLEFADQILKLAEDQNKQQQMSQAGRKTFEDNYTWDIIGKKIEEILAT